MIQKQAFTLIELLVVVLIIGILAAVAVPQYQKAVLKSRLSALMTNTRTIANACEVYYLANGEYPDELEKIDLEISGCETTTDALICPYETYRYHNAASRNSYVRITGLLNQSLGLAYMQSLAHSPQIPNTRECWADENNQIALNICNSLKVRVGGRTNSYSGAAYGHSIGDWWKTYVIP